MTELTLAGVSKRFGNKILYKDLNFKFDKGCYLIQGKNGIGKSVLLQMLSGIIMQDSGDITLNVEGVDYRSSSYKYKSNISYVPSSPSFFPMVNGLEFLSFVQSIKCKSKEKELLAKQIEGYGLSKHLSSDFEHLSLGTKKKLFLTTLSIKDNKIILLDEPTIGLDDVSKNFFLQEIANFSKTSIVILVTHDISFFSDINHSVISLCEMPISSLCIDYIKVI